MSETIFYDGHCGLCHRFVRFVIARDETGKLFRFAPINGNAFHTVVSEPKRRDLPDSIVLLTADGQLLIRSSAVLHVLYEFGGGWRFIARVLGILPSKLLDVFYDAIARMRLRFFKKPDDVCPIVPIDLRDRFLS